MIADVFALERGTRAGLVLEAGAPVYDGVVAEEREGDEEGGKGKCARPVERGDGDDCLDAYERDGDEPVEFGAVQVVVVVGGWEQLCWRGLEKAQHQGQSIREDEVFGQKRWHVRVCVLHLCGWVVVGNDASCFDILHEWACQSI